MKKILTAILTALCACAVIVSIFPLHFLQGDARWTYRSDLGRPDDTDMGTRCETDAGVPGAPGLEIMYREQYMIADENYLIDISETKRDVEWSPQYNDTDMMTDAFREYREKQGIRTT